LKFTRLAQATRIAILSANYVARRLAARYPIRHANPG
jgi:glycine cleavage system protein P-like pyridoxal-binding family